MGQVLPTTVRPGEDEPEPSVLTGATAGATESFVVVPFELVKIRLQDKASAGKYSGMIDVVVKTVKAEGILAMYNGLESTLWRHILWNAGYFGCIFQVRQLLPKADTKQGKIINDIIAGTIGGTVGTILNTPMDVVKSRIQNSPKVAGATPKYNWAWPSVGLVAKRGRIRCSLQGLPAQGSPIRTWWWYSARGLHRCYGLLPQDAELRGRG